MSAQPYPTPTRKQLVADIDDGLVRWYHFLTPEARHSATDRKLTAEVNTLRNCEPPIAYVPPGPEGGYSVVGLTPEGRVWLAAAMGMCVQCLMVMAKGTCCSSHGKKLCHACYRRTHFSELCVVGCSLCIAEGLPYGTERLVEVGDQISADVAGIVTGVAWGPAADGTGEWFVRSAEGDTVRVADQEAARSALRGLRLPASYSAATGGAA